MKVLKLLASRSEAVIEVDGVVQTVTMLRLIGMDKPNPKKYSDFIYKVFINGKWQEVKTTKATKYC